MRISDIISSPWAILPEKLAEIKAFYAAYSNGEKIDIAAIEARIGKPLVSENQGYQVVDGVAVIPINGVIGKRMNLMSQISGGSSSQLITRDVKAAVSDPSVNSILLHIDSPGGTVDGTQNLADVISAAGKLKPTIAFADGTMASAAYWFGSAANEIVASSETTEIGSIGVLATHTDVSKAKEAQGIKVTEITAGKYKGIGSQHAPLSEEAVAHIQGHIDQIYTIFVDTVAENRGVDTETVLEDMADGRVFLAKEAKDRGMVDHIASLEQTIFNMSTGVWPVKKETQTTAQAEPVAAMDLAAIKENFPDIAAQLTQEGAAAERDRIKGCEDATLAGHEALVAAMKYDGKSTAADVALAIIGAEKTIRAKHHNDFVANAPQAIPHATAPLESTYIAAAEDKNLPIEERAKAKWDASTDLRIEFNGNFDSYLALAKAEEKGQFRILNTK